MPDNKTVTWEERLTRQGVNPTNKAQINIQEKARRQAESRAQQRYDKQTGGNSKLAKVATEAFNSIAAYGTTSLVVVMGLVLVLLLVTDTLAVYDGLATILVWWKSALIAVTLVLSLFVTIFLEGSYKEIIQDYELKDNDERVQKQLQQAKMAHRNLVALAISISVVIILATTGGRLGGILEETANMPASEGFSFLLSNISLPEAITVSVLIIITPVLILASHWILSVINVNFTRLTGGVQVVSLGGQGSLSLEDMEEAEFRRIMHNYVDHLEVKEEADKS